MHGLTYSCWVKESCKFELARLKKKKKKKKKKEKHFAVW